MISLSLKNLDSKNLRDINRQEITNKDGGPLNNGPEIVINYENLSDKPLEELLEYPRLYPGQKLDSTRISEETWQDIRKATELHSKGNGVMLILPSDGQK